MNTNKPALLYLVHRIPYPPNKGDKIRSFNILKMLSQRYRVYLACFLDDPQDLAFIEDLSQWCEASIVVKQNKLLSKIKGLSGFATNMPITIPYYASAKLQKWIDLQVQGNSIEHCVVFSAAMLQFVEGHPNLLRKSVVDFVDVDSDKWRQYAQSKTGITSWFYNREAKLLSRYEKRLASATAYSTFVSDDEAALFKNSVDTATSSKVSGIRNGVDTEFFDPCATSINKLSLNANSIVFTGAMDYWANVNAVLWFVEHVWSLVLAQHPAATFYVVGSKPSAQISALDAQQNITVTGRVEDVRPYILESCVSIAPLQIARGIQNKVLEALAMAKPIVLSSMAAEGIKDSAHSGYYIHDLPQHMADEINRLLSAQSHSECSENREFVKRCFSWESEMDKFAELITQGRDK